MASLVIKGLISALIISTVTAIAQRHPSMAGWIAALPLVSILTVLWLVLGHQPTPNIINFLSGVLKGLIPTAVLLFVVLICLRRGLPFIGALLAAIFVWGGSALLIGKLGG